MRLRISETDFEDLVADALDEVPPELAREMSNVVVLVEPYNEEEPGLLGLYHGVALTERTHDYGGFLPDTITIYREPLLAMCTTREQLAHEVKVTVMHEIAHHFGIGEEWLHAHGWG